MIERRFTNRCSMRITQLSFISMISVIVLAFGSAAPAGAVVPDLTGRLIALDAGHGNGETGAENKKYPTVIEAEVNQTVALALEQKLMAAGATVVFTDRVSSRRERVRSAIDKCKATALARACDILVSVHHNGSTDPTHDGTLAVYNEQQDIPLATAIHDALITSLGLPDEGYLSGGYGITVYGHLISAVSEGYYITNDCEAELYLYRTTLSASCNKTLYPDGDRVNQEALALFDGVANYFGAVPPDGGGGGGGKPDKCTPWPSCRN